PSEWVDRAEVQHALGRLYAEYAPAGFTLARTAMLRAIAEDSSNGLVPISTIEQLINLETRQARRLSASGQEADIEQALQLASSAIERGESLLKLSRDGAASMQVLLRPNTERQSILGSAYKCKA